MHEYLYLLNLPVSSPSRGVHGNSKRADLVESQVSIESFLHQRRPSSSLDHLSKVGHDGLLVIGGERVVAGDANSGGSVREVVPGFLGFFWWLWSITYKIRTGLAKKWSIITTIIESYNIIAFVNIQKVGLACCIMSNINIWQICGRPVLHAVSSFSGGAGGVRVVGLHGVAEQLLIVAIIIGDDDDYWWWWWLLVMIIAVSMMLFR